MIPVIFQKILRWLFPNLIWDIKTQDKNIYLTFDDGPEPEITTQVLALLYKYNIQATFFCLGEKAEKFPDLVNRIKNEGHVIGNHGYRHISGFSTKNSIYFENFKKGAHFTCSDLFRPPYGRITPNQIKSISKHSKIILWSIMSMDFKKIAPDKCIKNVLNPIFPGAIIVFHDNQKASTNLLNALPIILESLLEKGYNFKTLC